MSYRTSPIIFNGDMIRAILAGRKNQTRRVLKPQPDSSMVKYLTEVDGTVIGWVPHDEKLLRNYNRNYIEYPAPIQCPYGVPGQRLWCRETWCAFCVFDQPGGTKAGELPPTCRVRYKADGAFNTPTGDTYWRDGKWRPSIHMPRCFSRITLEITDVRVQRVADISEEDAKAEGVQLTGMDVDFIGPFSGLWELIHGDGAWERNDFVWALTFKRINE